MHDHSCPHCGQNHDLAPQKGLPPQKIPSRELADLADIFKVLSDPTRLRIISILFQGEVCVCQISSQLEMSQSAISHQLRLLRGYHLVKTRREGRQIYYSLDDDHVETIIGSGLAHVRHIEQPPASPQ